MIRRPSSWCSHGLQLKDCREPLSPYIFHLAEDLRVTKDSWLNLLLRHGPMFPRFAGTFPAGWISRADLHALAGIQYAIFQNKDPRGFAIALISSVLYFPDSHGV
jgi:hypothetical protein